MERISVIVPVYGVEAYLDRCVQSLLEQSYRDFELILVDDGSPDSCGAMCDAWAAKDGRIKVVHKENGGLSDARNAGLAVASGAYIAFVDSDDWVAPDYIRMMAQAIDETGAQIAACDILPVYDEIPAEGLTVSEKISRICGPKEALGELICGRGFRAVAWNKLYHRTVWENMTFPTGVYHEDEYVIYRVLARAEKLVYLDVPLYYYYQRQGSIMHSVSPKRLDVLNAYWERLCFFKEQFPDLYEQEKVAFCTACAMCYSMILSGEVPEAEENKRKICGFRAKVRFSWSEFCRLTLKQKAYVWGTGCCMEYFCRLLYLRKGRKCNV